MKAFSFFSGKGGVGKTTLSIMFASFLAYCRNLKVLLIDMEKPDGCILPFRKGDIQQLQTAGAPLYNYAQAYPMPCPSNYFNIEEYGLAIGEYSKQKVIEFVCDLKKVKEKGNWDVMILDFPARYGDNLPVHILAKEGLLDAVYVPTGLEQQERRSACIASMGLASCGVKTKIVWNDVDADIVKRGKPLALAEQVTAFLQEYGVTYSPVRIKHFRKATQTTEDQCFVRSTVCWPDKYVRLWCPELITLFEEICNTLEI